MQKLFFGFVMIASVLSIGSTVVAAKMINEGVKPSHSNTSNELILGHRVTSQGQFVLVTR